MTYVFGRCLIRTATRELVVDGIVQATTPKVFDLLVHLVSNRHRVVPKDELIEAVWGGLILSASVLARTVMLARRLIGDDALQPRWIRNVHGVGYRFVGSVATVSDAPLRIEDAASAKPDDGDGDGDGGCPRHRPLRIGLMPPADLTADTQLAWLPVGLMSLAAHALQPDGRMSVRVLNSELGEGRPGAEQTPASLAVVAQELLGLDVVVHGSLRKQGGAIWLDYELVRRAAPGTVGSLRDVDPLSLGARFAQALASHAFGTGHFAAQLLSKDPFVNQAFARAMAFLDVQNWPAAAALLGAAQALEPDSMEIRLELARTLLWMHDPRVVEIADDLLRRLDARHEARLHSRAHDLMALALQMRGRSSASEAIEAHRQQSVRLCEGQPPADWTVSMRINGGNHELDLGRYDSARRHFQVAIDEAGALGDQVKLAMAQQNLAVADRVEGDFVGARQRLEDALRVWRRLPRRPIRAHALAQLAQINIGAGLIDQARHDLDEALGCLYLGRLRGYELATASKLCLLYLEIGLVEESAGVASHVPPPGSEDEADLAPRHAAAGCIAQAKGRVDAARHHFRAAVSRSLIWPGVNYQCNWLLALVDLELACGDDASMRSMAAMVAGAPNFDRHSDLRAAKGRLLAGQLLGAGKRMDALNVLIALLHETPAGRSGNLLRFDAAWLHLELDQVENAESLIHASPTWRDRHPTGIATHARLRAAQGRATEARALQQRAFALWSTEPHATQVHLSSVYARQAEQPAMQAVQVPALPRLLSATWLAGVGRA